MASRLASVGGDPTSWASVQPATVDGFRAGFGVICLIAAIGAVTAGVAFRRGVRPAEQSTFETQLQAGNEPLVPIPVPAERHPQA